MRAIKCVCEGPTGSGKTSLLVTYTTNQFPEKYIPTVFDNYSAQIMVDKIPVCLGLWDIMIRSESGERLRPLSYPQTDIFLLCFDVSNPATLIGLEEKFFPLIDHHCPEAKRILVGCKADLRDNEDTTDHVPYEEALRVSKTINALKYIECSAKTRANLKNLFEDAIRTVLSIPVKKKKRIQPCLMM
eukprot:TRINITY_DN9217_c0_g1_i1.p1 TRINITY_DN9217_c0_g1~~TRINITY_DN9217_c0_g1_i1.p1  ORF type:complete len:198 (+),score=31.80 TRINITY_DN9217_c0_g1_i1:36-596(+)